MTRRKLFAGWLLLLALGRLDAVRSAHAQAPQGAGPDFSDGATSPREFESSSPWRTSASTATDAESGPASQARYSGDSNQVLWLDSAPKDDATGLAKRVADLEKQLKKKEDAEKKKEAAAAKKFVVRPFGRIHIDGASFSQDAANKATVGNARNGVDIRRARMGIEGEGFDTFFYRFDVDFVTFDQSTTSRPVIVDAYFDTQNLPVIGNVRAGHFREPFSLDRLDSTNDLPFLERTAVVNTLVPFRNLGVMGYDWNEDETMTWSYGAFDENTNEFGEDSRDRAGYAFTGRATWLPYFDTPAEGRYLWHVGASYSFRRLGLTQRRFNQTPEVQVKEGSGIRTPSFVDTGLIPLDHYHVAGIESVAVLGSLSLQAEYIFLTGTQLNGSNIFFDGGYVEAMYWLTGENRNYNRKLGIFQAVTPYSNFFRVRTESNRIAMGSGAWEATARVSNLRLDNQGIHGGQLVDMTFGLNWYYAVRSRVMFNYIHAFLDRNSLNSNADIFAMRYQFAF